MVEYCCHYIEAGEAKTRVVVEARDDAAMLLEAEALLAGSGYFVMEVWQDDRLVGRVTIGTPAEWAEGSESTKTRPPVPE